MLKILIVDDDFMVADCLEEILVEAGYDVCGIAGTVEDAIALGDEHHPDLGIIDLRLADGRRGIEVAAALRSRRTFGVLYATGNPDHVLLRDAPGEGYIGKPYTAEAILAALRLVHEKSAVASADLPERAESMVMSANRTV
jgi:two-component system, response regulator PdtaR